MNKQSVAALIEKRIREEAGKDGSVSIPLKKGEGRINVKLGGEGIMVSNLGRQPMLPWAVFEETVALLRRSGGKAFKGDAMNGKLGDSRLPIDSIEGYLAYKLYDKKLGESVFRRITPISCVLEWAGICDNERGELIMRGPKSIG
jgi:hypothetical protein